MNKGTLRAFSAGIIFATTIVTMFYYGSHLNEGQAFTQADAKKMLEDQGFSVLKTSVVNKIEKKDISKNNLQSKSTAQTIKNKEVKKEKVVSYILKVKYRMTVEEIAEILKNEKIIDNATEFKNYMRDQKLTHKVQVNEYIVTSDMSYEELGKLLTQ